MDAIANQDSPKIQCAGEGCTDLVLLKIGAHWLEESTDDGTLRVVASPTQGSLFVAETAERGYRLRACGSARPLMTEGGVLALGEPHAEAGPVCSLPMTEWKPSEGSHAPARAVPESVIPATAGDLSGYRIAPEMFWDDKEHKQLIEDAFATVMRFPDDKAGVKRVKALWSNPDFRAGVLQGLHDADYQRQYINLGTYASHFFDPDTKQNWLPLLFPSQTAYSETLRFAHDAANLAGNIANGGRNAALDTSSNVGAESLDAQMRDTVSAPSPVPSTAHGQCGFKLGLALHYFSDLTQPMHAANVVNAVWANDWRHRGFEQGADERGPAFRIDPSRVSWADVDPGTMQYLAQLVMQVAINSKRIYKQKVEPVMASKVREVLTAKGTAAIVYDNAKWGPEADPILREAIPAGQLAITKFLVMWSRTSAFNGSDAVYWPRKKPWSDHAPFFFSFRGRTYIVYVDTYQGKNDVYVQPYDNPEVSAKQIVSGVKGVPSVVEFEGRLVMGFAKGDAVQCLASIDAQNWTAAPAPAYAQISQHSRPALCVHEGRIFMVWVNSGHSLFWSTLSAGKTSWANPQQMSGKAASYSPTLAVFNGRLHAAWTGKGKTDWVFYARYENEAWSSQDSLEAAVVKSNSGPALIVVDGLLFAFYRRPGDDRICFSQTTDGRVWDGGRLYPMPGEYTTESDMVASPLPGETFVGWSRGHTLIDGYRVSHRLMCARVGSERSYVEIPDGSLVRAFGRTETYVVCGYAKFLIPNNAAFTKMKLDAWDIRYQPVEVVNALTSTPTDGSLLREYTDPRVWYMVAGARLHVENSRELDQLATGRATRYTSIPDGTVGTVPEKFQRESVAIKVSVNPGQPLKDVPLRGWKIFNLVRMHGEVKRSSVDISRMNDEDLRQLVAVALIAPQSALRTPEVQ